MIDAPSLRRRSTISRRTEALRTSAVALLAVGLLVAATACKGKEASPAPEPEAPPAPAGPAASELGLSAEFRTLWWSIEQMDGLNPDDPPPKETEVTLSKWELTDPIGVPNPDWVDVVTIVKNTGSEQAKLTLHVKQRWKVGNLDGDAESALWLDPKTVGEPFPLFVAAGGTTEHRFRVDVKEAMDPLFEKDKWPFVLEADLELKRDGATLKSHKATLPLTPGD